MPQQPASPEKKAFKILIVDDDEYSQVLLSSYCSRLGYKTIKALNGEEGVRLFEETRPDIVLMDVLMPVMNGMSAAKIIKSRQTVWRPIIFLTGVDEDKFFVTALEHGGDDFISKPVNFTILTAKLASLKRTLLLNQEVSEQAERLSAYREAMQDELSIARDLIQRFVYSPMRQDINFDYWVMPAEELSGDVVAMARTPSGTLHMMLADGIGHGLHAAINVIPITPIFYGMTAKGSSLAEIIRELDKTIRKQLPVDRFVSAILVAVDEKTGKIQAWNGGIPKAYFLNNAGEIIGFLDPHSLPLGLHRKKTIQTEIREFPWEEDLRLIIYSDGLLEVRNHTGESFGHERLKHSLRSAPKGKESLEVRESLIRHVAGKPLTDDVSFALLRLDKPKHLPTKSAPTQTPDNGCWHFELVFGPPELKHHDMVYFVMRMLDPFEFQTKHFGKIQMALTELFSNALEHGLLGLSSELKQEDDIEFYYTERARRLESLVTGEIRINLHTKEMNKKTVLHILVGDSGPGFDAKILSTEAKQIYSGRGIPLLRKITDQLNYNPVGNQVEAIISLS